MLNEETRRKLREMNFGELVDAFDLQEKQAEYLALPFYDRMNLAVDYAYSAKYNAKVHRLIKAAKFRIADAVLSNIHYENRVLDKDFLLTLGTCGFVSNNQPVVINGFTGSGKSYLACAIGRQACMQGFRSRYIRVPDLMELLSEATLTTSGRSKLQKKFSGYRLLILDEWLLNDLTELEQHFFFELIERRYDCTLTIFCTQYKREDWHSRLGGFAGVIIFTDSRRFEKCCKRVLSLLKFWYRSTRAIIQKFSSNPPKHILIPLAFPPSI